MKEHVAWLATSRRGRLVVRNCWLRSSRRSMFFAAVYVNIVPCVREPRVPPCAALREQPLDTAFKCIVLTVNASERVDPRCSRFLGSRFREEEFEFVSADAQLELQRPELQEHASDLSNNDSVSIFMNHMRVWSLVSASADDTPVLVLEDDTVLPPRLGWTLGVLLERLREDNVSNYIVKLHNSQLSWTSYRVERYDVCVFVCYCSTYEKAVREGGGGEMEDMCYERLRAEADVN